MYAIRSYYDIRKVYKQTVDDLIQEFLIRTKPDAGRRVCWPRSSSQFSHPEPAKRSNSECHRAA